MDESRLSRGTAIVFPLQCFISSFGQKGGSGSRPYYHRGPWCSLLFLQIYCLGESTQNGFDLLKESHHSADALFSCFHTSAMAKRAKEPCSSSHISMIRHHPIDRPFTPPYKIFPCVFNPSANASTKSASNFYPGPHLPSSCPSLKPLLLAHIRPCIQPYDRQIHHFRIMIRVI